MLIVVPIEHNLVLIKTLIHDQLRNSIKAFLPFNSLLCVYLTIYTYPDINDLFCLLTERVYAAGAYNSKEGISGLPTQILQ